MTGAITAFAWAAFVGSATFAVMSLLGHRAFVRALDVSIVAGGSVLVNAARMYVTMALPRPSRHGRASVVRHPAHSRIVGGA